jgi:6-pyruvoyltetrahydropterin/6-carboxytetrahydropterin synthase
LKVKVSRKGHFNAAHRLHNPNWSDEKNREVFGNCNNVNYHGHNYVIYAHVTGPIDEESGYVIDLGELKEIMNEEVLTRYDHKNLNLDCEDFKHLNPTAENIVVTIWQRMRKRLKPSLDLTITLYETERNFVEYSGE